MSMSNLTGELSVGQQMKVRITYERHFNLAEDKDGRLVVDDSSGGTPEEAIKNWIQEGYLHEFVSEAGEETSIELELPNGQVVNFNNVGDIVDKG